MSLQKGARLGPYEILDAAGAGGMGEVYRAKDTRLDRTVAIKVLPAGSASSPDLRQRFEREAKAVSSLNHPNICTLYDVGHHEGTDYLVMEYLEGETLAVRLEKGPLATAELLKYAVQIADALDKAHRQGLVHRDLKPGNIMLTKSGAKLLDFGLAKLATSRDVVQGITGVTRTTPLTGEGTILGTLHYMPPEQLEGQEADARSDIFAFGCVLYEMATGKRAFEGKSQASLIAAIMGKDPAPVSSISQLAPPDLDRIVSRCIAKDPDDRWQTARDLMHELHWMAGESSQISPSVASRIRGNKRHQWVWLVATSMVAATAGALLFRHPQAQKQVLRTVIPSPNATKYVTSSGGQLALSPDGQSLAFVAEDSADGNQRLWVRPLQSMTAFPLPGTDGALFPFWSPDGRFIAFFADGKLKKIQSSGGPALRICDAPIGRGGTWNREGVIVFCPNFTDVLYRVPAAGGTPVAVTTRDSLHREWTHRWPQFLPDGNHFVYLARTGSGMASDQDLICAGSLDGMAQKTLVNTSSDVAYADGYLLFMREGTLMAQPFNPGSTTVSGDAVPIADSVSYAMNWSRGIFSVSQPGLLVYQSGPVESGSAMIVFGRQGQRLDSIGSRDRYRSGRYSPDGNRVALSIVDPTTDLPNLWIYEIPRGIRTRFTSDSAGDQSPVWSPDGRRIAFLRWGSGGSALLMKSSDGVGEEELMVQANASARPAPSSWSSDGEFLSYSRWDSTTEMDIWIMPLSDTGKPYPLIQTRFSEGAPSIAPDDRWLAYVSYASGKREVYVTAFPLPGRKWQVSISGGRGPLRWRRDGKELFYLGEDNNLMVAEIDGRGAELQVGSIRPLFQINPFPSGAPYDASADGQSFLVNTLPSQTSISNATLVVNWAEELKKP